MSSALLGATLLALGGSVNDFMTGFMSALMDDVVDESNTIDAGVDEKILMWYGSIFGCGFFCNTFVAAMVMVSAPPEGIPVKPGAFTRDICFRMLAVALMLIFALIGEIHSAMACAMILLYVVYVLLTLRESRAAARPANGEGEECRTEAVQIAASPGRGDSLDHLEGASFSRKSLGLGFASRTGVALAASFTCVDGAMADFQDTQDEHHSESTSVRLLRLLGWEEDGSIMDKVNFWVALPVRPLFVLTMATPVWDPVVNVIMPLTACMFIPYGNPFGNMYAGFGQSIGVMICIGTLWVVGFGLVILIKRAASQSPVQGRYISPIFFYWMTFLTSLLWVGILANEVIGSLQTMGVIMQVPAMTMGITMLSWGNSIDNVFTAIGLAKAGEFAVAITGIYATPMFDVLMSNGFILLLCTIREGLKTNSKGFTTVFVITTCPWILWCCLMVILAFTLVYARVKGWRISKTLGILLALSYPVILCIGFWLEGSPMHTAVQ